MLVTFLLPATVSGQQAEQPHVIVVLADALRFEDINNPDCAVLKEMATRGSLGLMNCAVAGQRSGVTANLTLAAGRQIRSEPTDASAFNDWEAVPGENGEARMAYMRRVGPLDPAASQIEPDSDRSVKHLGSAGLERRGLNTDRLGALLARHSPPVTAWVGGNADTYTPDRSASLLTVDSTGICAGLVSLLRYNNSETFGFVDDPTALAQSASEAAQRFNLVVLQVGDFARLESARNYLSDLQFHARRDAALRRLNALLKDLNATRADTCDLMLVSARPVANPLNRGAWDRLPPILAVGPHFPPGLLTSPTTRTTGLVANIDFAPTILDLFRIAPSATMTGRAMAISTGKSDAAQRLARIERLDRISGLNEGAKTRLLVPIGLFCFVLVSFALATKRYAPMQAHLFAPAFIFILNLPAAMLLAPIPIPATIGEYGVRMTSWSVGLTLVCYIPSFKWRISPAIAAMVLTTALLAADTVTSQSLQKDSVFCGYAVAGIRYYGIGNEYLGLLIPFSLLCVTCALDDFNVTRLSRKAYCSVGILWLALALVCGWPSLGANSGSLVLTFSAFGTGLILLRGRKPRWFMAAAWAGAGLLTAFILSVVDSRLNGAASSHSGAAVRSAASGRGMEYLAQIAARKIVLNLHYLTTPEFLAGMAATGISLLIANAVAGETLRKVLTNRFWLRRSLFPLGAAAAAALLFKDSGVVTVDFMAGSVVVILLYYMIIDSSSIHAKQENV